MNLINEIKFLNKMRSYRNLIKKGFFQPKWFSQQLINQLEKDNSLAIHPEVGAPKSRLRVLKVKKLLGRNTLSLLQGKRTDEQMKSGSRDFDRAAWLGRGLQVDWVGGCQAACWMGWVLSGCLMTVLGAVRLHGRGVARLHDDWISLGDGGWRKFAY